MVTDEEVLPYAEDGVGLTTPIKLFPVVPVVVQVILSLLTPVGVWSAVLGLLLVVEVVALTYVHQCWLTGIRVTRREVRIGGCRSSERRRRRGKPEPPNISPHFRLRHEFVVPVDAVRTATIVEPDRFADYPTTLVSRVGGRTRKRLSLAGLRSRFAAACLVLDVDLSRTTTPQLTPYVVEQLAPHRTSGRYVLTDQWTVATRHPDRLAAALHAAGVPVDPSPGTRKQSLRPAAR